MQFLGTLSMIPLALLLVTGCGKGWQMEYGKEAAHFNEDAVLEKARPFLGKKIVVKGVVTKQDFTDPENCKLYLQHSICCNFGRGKQAVEAYKVGKAVFVRGFLKRCEEGGILLEPAGGRDPKAEFNPIE